jgi:putative Holliday junction resolvase
LLLYYYGLVPKNVLATKKLSNYPITKSGVQHKESTKSPEISEVPSTGRLIALDPGTKRIGVAICDETQSVCRPLQTIQRKSWKSVLENVKDLLADYDAKGLIVGLPHNFDGTDSEMTEFARDMGRKFSLSLDVPVLLQDERATSFEARGRLWKQGKTAKDTRHVDAEAAAIILEDFLDRRRSIRGNE